MKKYLNNKTYHFVLKTLLLIAGFFILLNILKLIGLDEKLKDFIIQKDNIILNIKIYTIIFIIILVFLNTFLRTLTKERNSLYRFFFWGMRVVIVITLIIGIWGVFAIFRNNDCGDCAIFKAIGLAIIIIWACIFLGYFIWAIYFYNINLAKTEGEWDIIKQAKHDKRSGNFYLKSDIEEEPTYNPYKDETFGLPPGTVRGMIAFTLLFGAIAMLIVSIGMRNELDPNSMFVDQYEFFKTAFLMMIAFYFGSRSLQYLKGNGSQNQSSSNNGDQPVDDDSGDSEDDNGNSTNTSSDDSTTTINPMDERLI